MAALLVLAGHAICQLVCGDTPPGVVGRWFTEILAAKWPEVINRICYSDIPLLFANVVLTKALGVRRNREIRSIISRRIDLWNRGLHTGLVGDVAVERAAGKCRASIGRQGEDKALSWKLHTAVLSGKIRQGRPLCN